MQASAFDVNRYATEFTSAWNEQDVEKALSNYVDDAEFIDPIIREPLRGKDAIRPYLEEYFRAFSEASVEVRQEAVAGKNVALLLHFRVRHTGGFEVAPGERVDATGRTVELDVGNFLTLDDEGRITRDVNLFDSNALARQLGVASEASRAGGRSQEITR